MRKVMTPEEYRKNFGSGAKKTPAANAKKTPAPAATHSESSLEQDRIRGAYLAGLQKAKDDARHTRMAWLKGLGIAGAVGILTLGALRSKSNERKEGRWEGDGAAKVTLRQQIAAQQQSPDFYDYQEPVHYPTAIQRGNAQARDFLEDGAATLESGMRFLNGVAGVADGVGDIQNAHHRTSAERARLNSNERVYRARGDRAELGVERAAIGNAAAADRLEERQQRRQERAAEKARQREEQRARAAARKAERARRDAERRANQQRDAARRYNNGR